MEISEIKFRLNIVEVARHLGIEVNQRTKRALCPFHNDKTPSLQFSEEKQICTCFSSNCNLGTVDVIGLTEKSKNLNTHEALKYLSELAGEQKPKPMIKQSVKLNTSGTITHTENLSRIAVLTKLMYEAKESMSRSKKAQDYCKQRGLVPNKRLLSGVEVEIGYPGNRFYGAWNQKLKQSAIEIGLLKQNPNGSLSPAFRNCIIFPVKNQQGQIIDIYGRSVASTSSATARHFYLKGKHQGIYPPHPQVCNLWVNKQLYRPEIGLPPRY